VKYCINARRGLVEKSGETTLNGGMNAPSRKRKITIDADSIKVGINIRNVKYDRVSYHSLREEFMDGSTQDNVSGLDDLGAHAFNVSKKVFNFNGRSHTGPRMPDKGSLDENLKKMQAASAADLSVVEGRSKKRGIYPGAVIELTTEGKKDGAFPSRPYGSYLVISTKHVSTSDCNYTNVFKAIPAGVKVLPTPEAKLPLAYSEIARVISNEDPKGKGRVQVQTDWQKKAEGLSTSWVRVMTPNAGKSGAVGTNRGFMFVPEPGDEIMLGYRYGDPSRPFVMGSVYNGMTGAGGDGNNKIKSITTRTGSTITFDDDEGDGMITISDPSGSIVTLNGDKTITITAPEKIDINSKEININATKKVNISGTDEVNTTSKKVNTKGTQGVNVDSDTQIVENAPAISIKGSTTAELTAGKILDIKSPLTTIKGDKALNLN